MTDVVPVCHEVPTKPTIDMALRLVDVHLSQRKNVLDSEGGAVRIVGWYTANANANNGDNDELPNPSACKIVSSIAECSNDESKDFVLLLVSTSRLVKCIEGHTTTDCLPICTVFEKSCTGGVGGTGAFTQKVDDTSITTAGVVGSTRGTHLIARAMERQINTNVGDGGFVYDYIDHLEDYVQGGDWIENGLVDATFVEQEGCV